MPRYRWPEAAVLLAVALFVSPSPVATQEVRNTHPQERSGRIVMPTVETPGFVRLESYFRIRDTREAARLLLEEAAIVGVDLDAKGPDLREEGVWGIPSRKAALESTARAYMMRAVSPGGEPDTTWCIIKLGRVWSIREVASILEQGIKIYRAFHSTCFIASVPADKEEFLASQEFEVVPGVVEG